MNHYDTIKTAIELIVTRKPQNHLRLDALAESLGMSPSHLRRVFVEWVGISPKQFHRYLSLGYAKNLLKENKTSLQTTVLSGLSSGGRLHDLFVDIEAMTPGKYQNGGANLTIYYSTFETKFGQCLVASTGRGICNILFFDNQSDGLADLQSRWPNASITKSHQPCHDDIINYFSTLTTTSKIKFHVHGSNFQIKVWEALLTIPDGAVSSYGAIAKHLGNTGASQAVGAAVGSNPIGYIIPCHRVLKSTGDISGYRWGVTRKRAMLAYEATRREGR